MVQEIYIIDADDDIEKELNESFKRESDEYKFKTIGTREVEVALRNIPALIIITGIFLSVPINPMQQQHMAWISPFLYS